MTIKVMLILSNALEAQNVEIPDIEFLHALIENGVDTNGDSLISYAEAEASSSLYLSNKGISDMIGIKAFKGLDSLDCSYNNITSLAVDSLSLHYLDVSNNTKLVQLTCSFNHIYHLDVSNDSVLTILDCQSNDLHTLDLSTCTSLEFLDISDMPNLTTVNVWVIPFPPVGTEVNKTGSDNVYFTVEYIGPIVNIPDTAFLHALIEQEVDRNRDGVISYNEAQKTYRLDISDRGITDMTGIKAFERLYSLNCSKNPITSLDCYNLDLTSLDVSDNTELLYLYCGDNKLTHLDVTTCTSLKELACNYNKIHTLELPNSDSLIKLYCQQNRISNLDVSRYRNLMELVCGYNQLTSLDISNNKVLWQLDCHRNQLTELDLSNMTPNYYPDENNYRVFVDAQGMPTLTRINFGDLYFYNEDSDDEFQHINDIGLMHVHLYNCPNVELTGLVLDIQDSSFLYALIEEGVDANGDSLINNSEAGVIHTLNVGSKGISDMTYIEVFDSLNTLDCSGNKISQLSYSNGQFGITPKNRTIS